MLAYISSEAAGWQTVRFDIPLAGYIIQYTTCGVNHSHTFLFGIRQPPILPYRYQYSTFGRPGLNRRVRDGYGCFPRTHRHRKIVLLYVRADVRSLTATDFVACYSVTLVYEFLCLSVISSKLDYSHPSKFLHSL